LLTVLFVNLAFPAYVVAPTVPLKVTVHEMVSVAEAPVADRVAQLRGVLAKDPETFPFVIVTALLPEVQLESVAVTFEGLVPPPESVSGGENETLADTAHETEPGAAPENFEGLCVLAATGDDTTTVATTPASMTVTTDRRTVDDAFRRNLSGFFTAERPPS